MQLYTPRLTLIPLTQEQFAHFLQDSSGFETAMGWQPSFQILDKSTQQAMEWRYWQGMEHEQAFLWYTNWQIIWKEKSQPVGFACFQGAPAAPDFTVELGYRIHLPYRRQGYMTEAAKALCKWALAQPGVHAVCAQTEQGNYPSEGVLKNCGMHLSNTEDTMGLWCISNVFRTKCAKMLKNDGQAAHIVVF